ncbi:MAG: hypothetical protein ACRDQX_01150 [Pseudonocardiaceae bacterium]
MTTLNRLTDDGQAALIVASRLDVDYTRALVVARHLDLTPITGPPVVTATHMARACTDHELLALLTMTTTTRRETR